MKTFCGNTVSIMYDGDTSGEAFLQQRDGKLRMKIDIKDIFDFVAQRVAEIRISEIEQHTTEQILFGRNL